MPRAWASLVAALAAAVFCLCGEWIRDTAAPHSPRAAVDHDTRGTHPQPSQM